MDDVREAGYHKRVLFPNIVTTATAADWMKIKSFLICLNKHNAEMLTMVIIII